MKFIQIEENVWGCIVSNGAFYLLKDNDGKIVFVDTGLRQFSKYRINKCLNTIGKEYKDIKSILLTHADGDHVGGLVHILRRCNPVIFASEETCSYLLHREMPEHYGRLNGLLRVIYFYSVPSIKIENIVTDNDYIDYCGGIHVYSTPGHCDGHLSFYLQKKSILFSGDLIVEKDGRVAPSPSIIAADSKKLQQSYEKMVSLNPKVICTGHSGKIVFGC
ncbi:MAG: MBL fold metallo-hydrolase [Patescibacteria group bacterium]